MKYPGWIAVAPLAFALFGCGAPTAVDSGQRWVSLGSTPSSEFFVSRSQLRPLVSGLGVTYLVNYNQPNNRGSLSILVTISLDCGARTYRLIYGIDHRGRNASDGVIGEANLDGRETAVVPGTPVEAVMRWACSR